MAGPAWGSLNYAVVAVTPTGAAMTGPAGTSASGLALGTAIPAAYFGATFSDTGFVPLGFTSTCLTASGEITGPFTLQFFRGFPGGSYFQSYFYDGSGWYGLYNPYLSGSSGGVGMDSAGDLAGWVTTASGANHTIVWKSDGSWIDLNNLGGGYWDMTPTSMNAAGTVVGSADNHAFAASGGSVQLLGGLAGESVANAVSADGRIVGQVTTASGNLHAFYTDNLQSANDIGTLGGLSSAALGVNSQGAVVGWAETASGQRHGFLYLDGVMTDLNLLLLEQGTWVIETALAVNDAGIILASAINLSGQHRTVLMHVDVPEPGTLGLALLGSVAAWILRRKTRPLEDTHDEA